MGASSHTIRLAFLSSSVVPFCLVMLHKLYSLRLIGIFNLECDVQPPGITEEATLETFFAIAIILLDLIVTNNARYRYVFPIHPRP